MSDTTSAAPSDAEIDAQWRESVAKHETTAAFVRDFARAVLAKWGTPTPPAVVESLTDEQKHARNPYRHSRGAASIWLSGFAAAELWYRIGIKGGQHGAE